MFYFIAGKVSWRLPGGIARQPSIAIPVAGGFLGSLVDLMENSTTTVARCNGKIAGNKVAFNPWNF